MDIEVSQSNSVTLIVPKGDLDMGTADQVKRTLTGLIEKGQAKLVMDLGGVTYIDSSGLGALVAAMKQARAVGGNLKLCALQEDVRSIFEMTRLIKVIAVHSDRQEAIASWGR
jgi:anti-sigma B factor antagonist